MRGKKVSDYPMSFFALVFLKYKQRITKHIKVQHCDALTPITFCPGSNSRSSDPVAEGLAALLASKALLVIVTMYVLCIL
jgi:hypothetical protein